jgi:hypothetical protein
MPPPLPALCTGIGSLSAMAEFDRRRLRPLVAQAQSTAPRPQQKIGKIILILWELLDSIISVKVKRSIYSQINLNLKQKLIIFLTNA